MTSAAWAIAGHGFNLRIASDTPSDVRAQVVLVDPVTELGPVVRRIEVAESGVRTFTVPWHSQPDGRILAAHPVGGNQVSWWPADDGAYAELRLTTTGDDQLTDVHVRFVLRHLTTNLLAADLAGRSVHAVTAALPDGGVLAVAGATRSGKTRLINHLAAAGLVGEIVDDDCPVLTEGSSLATLIPRRGETVQARRSTLTTLVMLSPDATGVREVTPERAATLLSGTPVPWPAPWLPSRPRTALPPLPSGMPMIEAPAQDEAAFDAVTAWLSSVC